MSGSDFYLHQYFGDFDEFCQNALNWDLEFRQLEPGAFSGHFVTLGNAKVIFSNTALNRHILQKGSSPRGLFTFGLLASPEISVYWRNLDISGDTLLMFPPDGEWNSISRGDFNVFLLSLTETQLEETCTRLELPSLAKLTRGKEAFVCDPDMIATFRQWLHASNVRFRVVMSPQTIDQILSPLADQLAEHIVRLLASSARHVERKPQRRRDLALSCAEDYINKFANKNLSIPELCRICNVSERTLQYAFRERYGLTPKEYILIQRLNNVRKQLLIGDPGRKTISGIVQLNGFWHMGQFAADYRRLFGELPSDTLKRSNHTS